MNKKNETAMIIDFNKIAEAQIDGFKGGEGLLFTRNYVDDGRIRIMRSRLAPGARSGEHLHGENSEVIYILRGTMTFHTDGNTEECPAGCAHYCPMGHKHWFQNNTQEDVEYLAIVPEHKVKQG